MLCQECQHYPATLHFTKIVNGEKMEMHLCETCAKDKGDYVPGSNSFSIHQLLSGLMDQDASFPPKTDGSEQTRRPELQCPECGMTYRQFGEGGRFGCAVCYETFDDKLDPVLARIHGGNHSHTGKIPKRQGKDLHLFREIEEQKEKLRKLIDEEAFEEAAAVRDRIRELRQKTEQKEDE